MPTLEGDHETTWEFQSAPGLEAGRCHNLVCHVQDAWSFNPRPALRPGDACSAPVTILPLNLFQSAPGLEAGRC